MADPGHGPGDPRRAHRPAARPRTSGSSRPPPSSGRMCRSRCSRPSPDVSGGRSSVGGLGHLQTAEFLYETSLFPDLEYTFKHALTHEVAYGSLLQDRRRATPLRDGRRRSRHLHDRAPDGARRATCTPCVPRRALGQGGRLSSASRSQGLRSLGQPRGGCRSTSRRSPRSPTSRRRARRMEHGVDVRLALRNALWPLGRFETGFAHVRDAERVATELGDLRRLGWIAAYLAEHTRDDGARGRCGRVRRTLA